MARPDFLPESGFGTVARPGWQEVVVPEPVGYAMQTWGWWLLAVVALAGIGLGTVWYLRQRKKNRYRREALSELAHVRSLALQADPKSLNQTLILLKRVALHAYDRRRVAALTGRDWAEFLSETCPETDFSAEVLETLSYRGPQDLPASTIESFLNHCETWIRRHRAAV